jgi:hypothetical protein
MAYDRTEVAVSKSQDGIRQLIKLHHGTGIMFISHPPREGFEVMIALKDVQYHLRIMATSRDISKDKFGARRSQSALIYAADQEDRRVWRVLYWHLKAIFEAADSGVIDIRDVILPYVVMPDGHTVSEHIVPQMEKLPLPDGIERLMLT